MRQAKVILNVIGSRLDIAENQDDIAKAFEGVSEDLGYKVKVIYTDPSNSPQLIGVDKNGNKYIKDGTAYVDKDTGIGYILINTTSPSNKTKSGVIGTIAEEQSHIIGKIEGRQKQVPDGSEKGLESLGRPVNDYVKDKLGDNSSDIQLSTDGIDLTNADVGEKVGDVITPQDREERTRLQKENPIGKYIQIDFDRAVNGMVGLAGSVFRGRASYGLIKSGAGLLLVPEPTPATKIAEGVLIVGGVVAGIFTISDAIESGQDVYYGVTNQRDKKSINFGREFLGEDSYDTLDMLSVAGMPILYQYGNYRRVIAEGEAAQSALAGIGNSGSSRLFLPNEYYDGKQLLPSQVTPGIKYLAKYDEMGNIKQIKMYDDYGRQIGWVDYTNHGYPSNHTIPHWHEVIYDDQYKKGIIIDHRTDINTPLGNK